jgi:hypothetical protein
MINFPQHAAHGFVQPAIPAHGGGYRTTVPGVWLISAATWPAPRVGGPRADCVSAGSRSAFGDDLECRRRSAVCVAGPAAGPQCSRS